MDRVGNRYHRDHRIQRQNAASVGSLHIPQPSFACQKAFLRAHFTKRHYYIGFVSQQVREAFVSVTCREKEKRHGLIGFFVFKAIGETIFSFIILDGAIAVSRSEGVYERRHQDPAHRCRAGKLKLGHKVIKVGAPGARALNP